MDLPAIYAAITGPGGLVFLLCLILYTGSRGDWVFRRVVEDKDRQIAEFKQREETWQSMALRTTSLAEIVAGLPPKGSPR